MKNNAILIAIIALVVGGAIGFYGGTKYQQNRRTMMFGNGQNGNGQFFVRNGQQGGGVRGTGNNMRGGFRPVGGEIISSDDKSITVKLADGSSKIIILSDKTQINKAETVTKSELKTGVKVAVFGSENTDGSITAQNIQLEPKNMMINAK